MDIGKLKKKLFSKAKSAALSSAGEKKSKEVVYFNTHAKAHLNEMAGRKSSIQLIRPRKKGRNPINFRRTEVRKDGNLQIRKREKKSKMIGELIEKVFPDLVRCPDPLPKRLHFDGHLQFSIEKEKRSRKKRSNIEKLTRTDTIRRGTKFMILI